MTDGEPLPELSEFLPYVLKTFNCLTSISITVACGVKAFIGIVGFRIDVSQHDIAATGVTGHLLVLVFGVTVVAVIDPRSQVFE